MEDQNRSARAGRWSVETCFDGALVAAAAEAARLGQPVQIVSLGSIALRIMVDEQGHWWLA